jgi:hypothetical protein
MYASSNVAVANGQLALRVVKSGKGKSSKSSCVELTLERSLGLGTLCLTLTQTPAW